MTAAKSRMALVLFLALGRIAGAQATIPTPPAEPKTPAECSKIAADWRRSQLDPVSAAIRTAPPDRRDNALKAYRDRSAIVERAVQVWQTECAKKFDLDRMTSAWQLRDLMRLDMSIPDTVGFWRVARRTLAAKDLTPRQRADVLVDESDMSLSFRADTGIGMERPERILREIDALPDSLADLKVHPNASIVAVYTSLGLTAAAGAHAPTLISLARRLSERWALQLGYESLARAAADRLHPDSALELLRASEREVGPDDIVAGLRRRYALIGTRGAPVTGRWWLNSPGSSAPILPGDGKVHLIEFTAHFCTRCRRTYPGLRAIADRTKTRDLDIVLATETYGFFESQIPASADEEVAADRAYYERDVPFRVAISPRESIGAPSLVFAAYEVGSERPILTNVPQIVLVDRLGIIRAIVSGFEEGREAQIGGLIETLLAERR